MTAMLTDYEELLLSEPQYRKAKIEAVEETDEKRLLTVRAVPYDVEVELWPGFYEKFEPGAFARAARDPGRVKLWHDHGGPIVGHAQSVEDREDGVWIRSKVSKTAAGDELLTLIKDGTLDEASIEFQPIREEMVTEREGDRIHITHKRARLFGYAVVPHGAYGRDALVDSVRAARRRSSELEAKRAAALERLRSLDS